MADEGLRAQGGFAAPSPFVVLLALSFAFNCFIAGGFIYARWLAPPHPVAAQAPGQVPERRLQMLVERLGLDPEKSRPFKDLRRGLHTAQQVLQAKDHPLGETYWEELSSPQPDEKHLRELVDEMNANRREFQYTVSGVLAQFMATLTPEQRAELVRIVEDRTNPAGAPVRNSVGN